MNKRKKQQKTSGEGLHPRKPPKNPRLRDVHGGPQTSKPCHSKRSEDSSGPAASAELSREAPRQAVSSCLVEETEAVLSLLGPSENEPVPWQPSQNSVRRFVPPFAKPKKTVTAEDPESGDFTSETSPESDVRKSASQKLEESLWLPLQEAMRPEDQMQEDSTRSEQSDLNSTTPVPNKEHACSEVTREGEPGLSDSGRANQDAPLGIIGNSRPETQMAWAPDSLDQEKYLPRADIEGKEPDSIGLQKEGAQGAQSGTKQLGGVPQDKGDDIPCTPALASASAPDTPCLTTGSMAQQFLVSTQFPRGTFWEAELSSSSSACTSLGDRVITDVSLDPSEPPQRALEVAMPSGHVPGRDCSEVLLGCTHPPPETTVGGEEARLEERPPGNELGSLAAFLALAPRNLECTADDGDPGLPVQEIDPGDFEMQNSDPDGQNPGGMCTLPFQAQPMDQEATELGSQDCKHNLEVLSMSSTRLLEHSYSAIQGTPGDPALKVPDSEDQAIRPHSSVTECDFLPDSQIKDALDASDLEILPEQSFPAGSEPGLDWPGPSSGTIRGDLSSVTKAQSRPHAGTQAQACRMQDATDTVRGLIVELSNLNRLIMSTHRDLEAFKRRKAKLPGKAPLPHLSNLCRGEQGWRDL